MSRRQPERLEANASLWPRLLTPLEMKRHARGRTACLYAPAGWRAWWRGLLPDLLPRCRPRERAGGERV